MFGISDVPKDVPVIQNLRHLQQRILDAAPANNPHKQGLSKDISEAMLLKQSSARGEATQFRQMADQSERYDASILKWESLPIWENAVARTFENQRKHIAIGCMQRRYPDLPIPYFC